jgi:peptidylprolyl isomerase
MKPYFLAAALVFAAWGASAQTQDAAPAPTMSEILDAAPVNAWRTLAPENTLYLDVPGGRVIIELAEEFAPNLAANVRTLTRQSYFDGAAIIRAQDNYVVQWGRQDEDPTPLGAVGETLAPEFDRASAGLAFTPLPDPDTYAPEVGFAQGFPAARGEGRAWLTHCYAMVGAGRGTAPESGNGVSLYVVIGQSPRHLDRNVVLVGRVLQGMELLSALPRGTGPLGFYETEAEAAPIARVRVAADLPEAERVRIEVLRTDTPTFAALVESRRNRRDDWFVRAAGRIEVCNVPLPVRAR